jgi:hypothetical protein
VFDAHQKTRRPAGPRPRGRAFLTLRKTPRVVSAGRPRRPVIYGMLLALMASCLAVTMTSGVASAAATSGVASAAIRAGHTIASAGTLSLGKKTIGGGGPIDFWKVPLLGGDQLQLIVKTPNSPCCAGYRFELYQPGTTDATFPQRPAVMGTSTANGSSGAVLVLQAPYNGTFILAVCEGAGDCRSVDSGGGTNPMGVYTFTDTLVKAGTRP